MIGKIITVNPVEGFSPETDYRNPFIFSEEGTKVVCSSRIERLILEGELVLVIEQEVETKTK